MIAAGAAILWGVAAIHTGRFRDWLAVLAGLTVGATLAVTGRPFRGRALQAFALALTALTWLTALYLAYFGAHLTEVSEHHGHRAADAVPVSLMATPEFFREFLSGLPVSVPGTRLLWLAAGLLCSAILTRRPR